MPSLLHLLYVKMRDMSSNTPNLLWFPDSGNQLHRLGNRFIFVVHLMSSSGKSPQNW